MLRASLKRGPMCLNRCQLASSLVTLAPKIITDYFHIFLPLLTASKVIEARQFIWHRTEAQTGQAEFNCLRQGVSKLPARGQLWVTAALKLALLLQQREYETSAR